MSTQLWKSQDGRSGRDDRVGAGGAGGFGRGRGAGPAGAAGRAPGRGPGRHAARRRSRFARAGAAAPPALAGRAAALFPDTSTDAAPAGGSPADGGALSQKPVADSQADRSPPPARPRLSWWLRLRLGFAERMPSWLRLRCGLEPRALLALLVVLVVAGGLAAHHFWAGRARAVSVAEPVDGARVDPAVSAHAGEPAPSDPAGGERLPDVVVDVAGEVRAPGLYPLPAGSRVADALAAAGGPLTAEDAEGLNQARLLVDGEQLLVGGEAPMAGPGVAAPPPGQGGPPAGPVSLNSATPEQLEALPGIGPVLAQEIVGHRQERGGFTAIDQLSEVTGIGERRLAELRDRVTL
ncbi:ComEA family DNA-binding protein [Streptomyces profundus]|uniref:ComEA family DNA-binding protein n=1 Tax=Streptomyces profundus TaxID=2867410 RepID=UPI001D15EDFD|nr:ComEA family DNA-binding protein [Streptomyces sp. MA3_2.13]UED86511.1 ComEA family DNA-binding protein [Streptomyces sp. MA3_2.13]